MPQFMQIEFLLLVFGWSTCFLMASLDAVVPKYMEQLANGYVKNVVPLFFYCIRHFCCPTSWFDE